MNKILAAAMTMALLGGCRGQAPDPMCAIATVEPPAIEWTPTPTGDTMEDGSVRLDTFVACPTDLPETGEYTLVLEVLLFGERLAMPDETVYGPGSTPVHCSTPESLIFYTPTFSPEQVREWCDAGLRPDRRHDVLDLRLVAHLEQCGVQVTEDTWRIVPREAVCPE